MKSKTYRLWGYLALASLFSACGAQNGKSVNQVRSTGLAPAIESGGEDLGVDSQSTLSWQNFALPNMSASFSLDFDVIPGGDNINGVTSISSGPATCSDPGAVVIRFNSSGMIDVLNGSSYAAVTKVAYSSGVKYHFHVDINPSSEMYSVIVTPDGSSDQVLAEDYAFGANVTSLDTLGVMAHSGSHEVLNAAITTPLGEAAPVPSPAPTHVPVPAPVPTHVPGPAPVPTHVPGPVPVPTHLPPAPIPTHVPAPAPPHGFWLSVLR